jgi:hypothetical protein
MVIHPPAVDSMEIPLAAVVHLRTLVPMEIDPMAMASVRPQTILSIPPPRTASVLQQESPKSFQGSQNAGRMAVIGRHCLVLHRLFDEEEVREEAEDPLPHFHRRLMEEPRAKGLLRRLMILLLAKRD